MPMAHAAKSLSIPNAICQDNLLRGCVSQAEVQAQPRIATGTRVMLHDLQGEASHFNDKVATVAHSWMDTKSGMWVSECRVLNEMSLICIVYAEECNLRIMDSNSAEVQELDAYENTLREQKNHARAVAARRAVQHQLESAPASEATMDLKDKMMREMISVHSDALALMHYEIFHRLPKRSASLPVVQATSAGVDGWAAFDDKAGVLAWTMAQDGEVPDYAGSSSKVAWASSDPGGSSAEPGPSAATSGGQRTRGVDAEAASDAAANAQGGEAAEGDVEQESGRRLLRAGDLEEEAQIMRAILESARTAGKLVRFELPDDGVEPAADATIGSQGRSDTEPTTGPLADSDKAEDNAPASSRSAPSSETSSEGGWSLVSARGAQQDGTNVLSSDRASEGQLSRSEWSLLDEDEDEAGEEISTDGGGAAAVPYAEAMAQLKSMGFMDKSANSIALEVACGNVESALAMLVE